MLLTTRSKQVKKIFREREQLLDLARGDAVRKLNPHRPLYAELATGAWRNEPCFLIAGGPSLIGFDFERLRGRGRVVTINRALEFVPWADIAFFMDHKLYKRYHEQPAWRAHWERFDGRKVFLNLMGRKLDDVFSLRSRGKSGVSTSLEKGLFHGQNSGYGALNLAIALGARPIYLLGYDMRQTRTNTHFHSGYGARAHGGVCKIFLKPFEHSAETLRTYEIYNLSPASALTIFKFKRLDEVLDGHVRENLGQDGPVVRDTLCADSPA